MDEQQAREEIQLIKTMLDKTKRATADSGTLFLVWGVLIALALIGDVVLSHYKLYNWIWLNWIGFCVIGWVYSIIYGIRSQRQDRVRTYIQTAARHLYIACGAGFLLVGLFFPWVGVYSYEAIVILVSTVNGILFFVMGGMFEWTGLRALALLWWAGAAGMSFLPASDRTLVFAGLFIVGYIIPVLVLRSKYRKEQSRS